MTNIGSMENRINQHTTLRGAVSIMVPQKEMKFQKKNVECSASKYNRCFMTRLSMIVTCILNAWETKINLLALAVSREHESKYVIAKQY